MVKHTQSIRWVLPTNCLSAVDHFIGSGLKWFTVIIEIESYLVIFIGRTWANTQD